MLNAIADFVLHELSSCLVNKSASLVNMSSKHASMFFGLQEVSPSLASMSSKHAGLSDGPTRSFFCFARTSLLSNKTILFYNIPCHTLQQTRFREQQNDIFDSQMLSSSTQTNFNPQQNDSDKTTNAFERTTRRFFHTTIPFRMHNNPILTHNIPVQTGQQTRWNDQQEVFFALLLLRNR